MAKLEDGNEIDLIFKVENGKGILVGHAKPNKELISCKVKCLRINCNRNLWVDIGLNLAHNGWIGMGKHIVSQRNEENGDNGYNYKGNSASQWSTIFFLLLY
jgi:hypothetical protein